MHMNDVVLALCDRGAQDPGGAYLLATHMHGSGRECPADVANAACWTFEDYRAASVTAPNPEPAVRYTAPSL